MELNNANKLAFTITFLIALFILVQFAEGQPRLSQARYRIASASAGKYALFAGGTSNQGYSNVVDIFDVEANVWFTSTLSDARTDLAATTVGNFILFCGGSNSLKVEIWNSSNTNWITPANLSQGTNEVATSVGKFALFAGGGVVNIWNSETLMWNTSAISSRSSIGATSVGIYALFAGGYSNSYSSQVDVWDSVTKTWNTTNLSVARRSPTGVSVGKYAIFAGGYGNSGTISTVDIWNNQTKNWTTAILATAMEAPKVASVGKYVLFGTYFSKLVDIWDSEKNRWFTANSAISRYYHGAVGVGKFALFAGGAYAESTNFVEVWSSECECWNNTAVILAPLKITTNTTGAWINNGHTYSVIKFSRSVSWAEASTTCNNTGGYLASITSEEENSAIFNLISNNKHWSLFLDMSPVGIQALSCWGPWIGGQSISNWTWINGEKWNYTNWVDPSYQKTNSSRAAFFSSYSAPMALYSNFVFKTTLSPTWKPCENNCDQLIDSCVCEKDTAIFSTASSACPLFQCMDFMMLN
jgi:hypothetical protein